RKCHVRSGLEGHSRCVQVAFGVNVRRLGREKLPLTIQRTAPVAKEAFEMLRKALLVGVAAAFFAAVGIPEGPFAPTAALAAKKCGKGMRANWRGKCFKAKVTKAKMAAKS